MDVDQKDLPARLAASLPGIRLHRVGDVAPEWSPERSRCHDNARRWVETNPTFEIVHGWLHAEGETFENRLRFHSHSVVRSSDGELLDVTLNKDDPRYAFVAHPFDDTHFREEVIEKIPTIDHWLGPDPETSHEWAGEDPELDNRQF